MRISRVLMAAVFVASGALCAQADEAGPRVIVKAARAHKHVIVKRIVVNRGERDGAVLFSGKVMSREYAYPRYSPGLLPTSVAVAYGYAYAPEYGFAYRLVPPVPAGAACVEQQNLVYNSQGVFVGYGVGYSCY
jgi:hypothetical protein